MGIIIGIGKGKSKGGGDTPVTHPAPTVSINSETGVVTATHTQQSGNVTGGTKTATLQLTTQGAQTINPTTADQEIAEGKYLTGKQTIKGDANLVPGNIASGVTIFGVEGANADGAIVNDAIAAVQHQRGSSEPINKEDLAGDIMALNSPATLEPYAVTVQVGPGTTVNVVANDRMKIRGNDGKSYTLKEWNDLFVAAGFDKDAMTVQPVGLDIDAFDVHECYMFDRYQGVTYQPAGVNAGSAGKLAHCIYNNPDISAAGSGTDSTTGKGWTITEDGDNLVLAEANTGCSWTIAKQCGYAYQHRAFNAAARTEAMWAINEWMRHRMAIDSEVATTEADGTMGEIGIFDANGDIAAVGADIYFWIKEGGIWTNTGKLAKYNVNNLHGSNAALLTSAIADAIYASQIAQGVNMDDTGVNSDTKPVLAPGCKGAECIAKGGTWMIITPFISNPNATVTTAYANLADSPAVYWAKGKGFSLPSDSLLQALWINKTMADAYIGYLNSREGRSISAMPTGDYTWSGVRYSAGYCWYVYLYNGNLNYVNTYYRYFVVGASAL